MMDDYSIDVPIEELIKDLKVAAEVVNQHSGPCVLWDGYCPVCELLCQVDRMVAHLKTRSSTSAHPAKEARIAESESSITFTPGQLKTIRHARRKKGNFRWWRD